MVKIRRAYEVLFLGLFLFLLLITDLRYLKGWPVSLFLEATPLVAVATALTTHTIYRNLVWGLVIIAITMMLGRVWCNWMCPFGILHHFFGWIGNRRNTKQMIEVNRYRKIYAIKYYILAAMLAMAVLWLIPTAIDSREDLAAYRGAELRQTGISRVFAAIGTGLRVGRGTQAKQQHPSDRSARSDRADRSLDDHERPALRAQSDRERLHGAARVLASLGRRSHLHWLPGGQLVDSAVLLPGDLSAGRSAGDLQPVRALADRSRPGSLHRLRFVPEELRRCVRPASRPAQERVLCLPELHRGLPARCSVVPLSCHARLAKLPIRLSAVASWSSPGCLVCFSSRWRGSPVACEEFQRGVIRPPGSVAEDEFLRRCIKCDQCIRVCPTNVLQPALFEAGLEVSGPRS